MTQEARYYYDCPIKAAFMAKYHRFKILFETNNGELALWQKQWIHLHELECPKKFFVAEESLPLLQPQVGDVVESTKGTMGGISVGFLKSKQWIPAYGLPANFDLWTIVPRFGDGSPIGQHWAKPDEWQKIIQRNGTPFIMPERGE